MDDQNFIVYLLDNGSDLSEGQTLQRDFGGHPKIKLILSESNIGFAKGNNLVLDQLLGEDLQYVALLNNDTEVDPDWLGAMVRTAKEQRAQVVASKLIKYSNRSAMDNAGHHMLNTGEIIPIGHAAPIEQYNGTFKNLGSCAAATLYDFQMIHHIGFFDPYFSTGYEDAEFGVRAYMAGYSCSYAPDAIVYHRMGAAIKKVFDISYAEMIQSAIWYTYLKLMPWQVILVSLPFILVKQISLTIMNLLFFRGRYTIVQFRALARIFCRDFHAIRDARRAFADFRLRSWKEVLKAQTFFLRYDFKRFIAVYLKGADSALDRYGEGTT